MNDATANEIASALRSISSALGQLEDKINEMNHKSTGYGRAVESVDIRTEIAGIRDSADTIACMEWPEGGDSP